MTLFESIGLGLIQGLTEFLPISSKGHLALAQVVFKIPDAGILYDIILHLGTLVAITIYYRKEWAELLRGLAHLRPDTYRENASLRFFVWMAIASVPTAFVGFLTKHYLESVYENPIAIGAGFLLTACILTTTFWTRKWAIGDLNWKKVLFIGLAQGLATLPGVSRSGTTIAAAMTQKVQPDQAARFSFFIAYPAIFGALLLKLRDVSLADVDWTMYGVGVLVSTITGLLTLGLLTRILRKGWLHGFAAWCIIAALIAFSVPLF